MRTWSHIIRTRQLDERGLAGPCVRMISLVGAHSESLQSVVRGGACEIITSTHMVNVLYYQPSSSSSRLGLPSRWVSTPTLRPSRDMPHGACFSFYPFSLVFLLAISRGVPVRRHDPSTSKFVRAELLLGPGPGLGVPRADFRRGD